MGIFIACVDDGCESHDLLHLVLEVTGEKKKDKEAKVATARTLWVPAVNHHGGFGRWDLLDGPINRGESRSKSSITMAMK